MANLEDLAPDRVADAVSRAVVDAVASGGDVESIVARALAAAERDLGLGAGGRAEHQGDPGSPERSTPPHTPLAVAGGAPISGRSNGGGSRTVLTEDDVRVAFAAGQREIRLGPRAIVTPLARDAAGDAGIRLVEG
jgi:hypothetical protein